MPFDAATREWLGPGDDPRKVQASSLEGTPTRRATSAPANTSTSSIGGNAGTQLVGDRLTHVGPEPHRIGPQLNLNAAESASTTRAQDPATLTLGLASVDPVIDLIVECMLKALLPTGHGAQTRCARMTPTPLVGKNMSDETSRRSCSRQVRQLVCEEIHKHCVLRLLREMPQCVQPIAPDRRAVHHFLPNSDRCATRSISGARSRKTRRHNLSTTGTWAGPSYVSQPDLRGSAMAHVATEVRHPIS